MSTIQLGYIKINPQGSAQHMIISTYMQSKATPFWYKSCSKPHEVTVDEGASIAMDVSCTEVDSIISTCGISL